MPSNSSKTLAERRNAAFAKGAGLPKRSRFAADGPDNDYVHRSMNAAGNDTLDIWGTDALDRLLIGGGYQSAFATPIRLNIQANGKIATTRFFTNFSDTTPLEIVGVRCIFSTANGAALTGFVSKEVSGQAPGSGVSVMSGPFDLNATGNTQQIATLAGRRGYPSLIINAGEHLSFKLSTAVTSLAGLVVDVYVRPHTGSRFAQYSRAANGDIATAVFDLNIIPGSVIRGVAISCSAPSTDAGAVTGDITKDTGTNAPGAGTSILGAAVNLKTLTANTAAFPALAASSATLTMASGDRLAFKLTGTPTALAGLNITVFFGAGPTDHIVIPISFWDAPATDRTLFIADQPYIVTDYWEVWSTASGSNTQLLTKDTGTTAPGAGTGLLTDNTNAGILTSATANTPIGSLLLSAVSTKPTLWLAPGDRLGIKNAGTTGSLAGVFGTILLRRP